MSKTTGVLTESGDIPVQKLPKGTVATVTALHGDADEVARLAALGIRQGVELCSLRTGCPCIVQFGCSRMCLRTSGQLQVMVSTTHSVVATQAATAAPLNR